MNCVYYTHILYRCRYNDLTAIPYRFEKEGVVIYNQRNCIKKLEVDGVTWNVKSFKTPNIINSIIYRYFRQPKALRSLKNAERLLKLGVNTPQPIAAIIEKQLMSIGHSFYISHHIDYDYTLGELMKQNFNDIKPILTMCLQFICDFHNKGVYFRDLSVGNILIKKGKENHYTFYLVDLNRIKFYNRPLTCNESIKAFSRLDTTSAIKQYLLTTYAHIAGFDLEDVMKRYTHHYPKEQLRRKLKKLHPHRLFNHHNNR